MNILPFRQKKDPKPLEKVDVSRRPVTDPFVQSLFNAGWKIESNGFRVWLVRP